MEVHSVTTVSPVNMPNHQPVLKGSLLHEHILTRNFQGDQHFFRRDGSVAAYPTMPGSDEREPVTHLVPHEDAPAFSDVATTATAAATSPLTTFSPTTPRPPLSFTQKKSSKDRTRGPDKVEPTTDSLTTQMAPKTRVSGSDNNSASPSASQRSQAQSRAATETTLASSSDRMGKGDGSDAPVKYRSNVTEVTTTTSTTVITTTTITVTQTSGRHTRVSILGRMGKLISHDY